MHTIDPGGPAGTADRIQRGWEMKTTLLMKVALGLCLLPCRAATGSPDRESSWPAAMKFTKVLWYTRNVIDG
jgi:hypothetical protein